MIGTITIKLRHAGIVISDKKRSLHFYRDLLGLKVDKDMNESGNFIDKILGLKKVRVNTIKMLAGGGTVELLRFHSHSKKTSPKRKIYSIGPSHVAFTVGDIEEEFGRLKRAGVKFISPPQISPDGRAKVVFCEDPDSNPIELVEMLGK